MTGRIGMAKGLVLAVALCAPVTLAHAQQATPARRPDNSNPIDVISQGLKLRADPVESKDFVRETHPSDDQMKYIPTGSARPQPPGKILNADQVKAKEAELEAMLAHHDKATGRRPYTGRATTGAAKPKTADAAR
jgi:hypothetical protein